MQPMPPLATQEGRRAQARSASAQPKALTQRARRLTIERRTRHLGAEAETTLVRTSSVRRSRAVTATKQLHSTRTTDGPTLPRTGAGERAANPARSATPRGVQAASAQRGCAALADFEFRARHLARAHWESDGDETTRRPRSMSVPVCARREREGVAASRARNAARESSHFTRCETRRRARAARAAGRAASIKNSYHATLADSATLVG